MPKLTALRAGGLAARFLLAALWVPASTLSADDAVSRPGSPAANVAENVEAFSYTEPTNPYQAGGIRPQFSTGMGVPGYGSAPFATSPAAVADGLLQPWQGVFFENDFSFLSDPNHEYLVGERFKDRDVRAL